MHMYTHTVRDAYRGQRTASGICFSTLRPIFGEISLDLELVSSARLDGQQVSRIFCLPFQHWDYVCTNLLIVTWTLKIQSQVLTVGWTGLELIKIRFSASAYQVLIKVCTTMLAQSFPFLLYFSLYEINYQSIYSVEFK